MKPLISIITVTCNCIDGLKRTLYSVKKQKFPDFEYIIIDGASTDGTKKYLSTLSLDKLRWISETDHGIYDAMNKGAYLAQGNYLYFLNSGDILSSQDIFTQLEKELQQNPDMLQANVTACYPTAEVCYSRRFCKENLSRGIQPPHQGLFLRKSVFEKQNGFNLIYKVCADFDLYCRLVFNQMDVRHIDIPVALYKTGGLSSHKTETYAETETIIRKYFGFSAWFRYRLWKNFEQTIKSLLLHFGLESIYKQMAIINNQKILSEKKRHDDITNS